MSSRRLATVLLGLSLGCQGWDPVLIQSDDFEPLLNVVAVLSPDLGGIVDVQVQRVLPLEGPSWDPGEADTVWYADPTDFRVDREQISRYRVTDAQVTLSDGDVTYDLVYSPSDLFYDNGARYIPTDSSFVPQPGATYRLTVETPEGLRVTGATTIPVEHQIDGAHTPDTLGALDPIPVAWRRSTGYYQLGISVRLSEFYHGFRAHSVTVVDDTSWLAEPIASAGQGGDGQTLSVLDISVTAMDENFYNYFIRDPAERNTATFIFLGEGDVGASYGIEGGLGVMGSYRYDAISRWVVR